MSKIRNCSKDISSTPVLSMEILLIFDDTEKRDDKKLQRCGNDPQLIHTYQCILGEVFLIIAVIYITAFPLLF
jgi:hypothetical protein